MLEASEVVLSVDAGQSGVQYEVRHGRELLASANLTAINNGSPAVPQLVALLQPELPTLPRITTVAIGSTGDDSESPDLLLTKLREFGVQRVLLAHDSITSYLGALGERTGAVIAAGTGVVTLAVGATTTARVDGWGHLLGDAGSGFWIGRAGLDAVLRAHDGRGPKTALSTLIVEDFPCLETMYVELQADPWRVRRIASYAKTILQLSTTDAVCASIRDRATAEMALSVAAGLHRVGEYSAEAPTIGCLGNVFRSDSLFDSFTKAVHAKLPSATVLRVAGNGIDGAHLMATLPSDHPLHKHIRSATQAHS